MVVGAIFGKVENIIVHMYRISMYSTYISIDAVMLDDDSAPLQTSQQVPLGLYTKSLGQPLSSGQSIS